MTEERSRKGQTSSAQAYRSMNVNVFYCIVLRFCNRFKTEIRRTPVKYTIETGKQQWSAYGTSVRTEMYACGSSRFSLMTFL